MTRINTIVYLGLVLLLGCSSKQGHYTLIDKPKPTTRPVVSTASLVADSAVVMSVPSTLGYDKFYKKYLDASGIPIISSHRVPDEALIQARKIVLQMVARIPQVKAALIKNNVRVAVMSVDEVTTDIPEHSDLNRVFPQTDWDKRARGLGPTKARPATSCAEENLLCYDA